MIRGWAAALASILSGCGARSDLDAERATEICNGIDDDGDGAVDEGIADLSCGIGACAASARDCVAGKPGRCTPRPPAAEVCNGVDDDCDGAVDEGLPFGLVSGPHHVDGAYPIGHALAPAGSGVLAVWSRGLRGGQPMANAVSRALDLDGTPIAEAVELLENRVVVGPSVAASVDGRWTVPVCRHGQSFDGPSWLFVDAAGTPASAEHLVSGSTEACVTWDTAPQMLWTGRRHLYSWITSTSDLVLLETSDASGAAPATALLVDNGDLSAPPRLVRSGDRVAVVLGLQPQESSQSELGVLFLDLDGGVLGPPLVLPDPGGARYLQPRAAVAADGTLLIAAKHRFGPGWIRARVGFDGTVLEAPVLLPEELTPRGLEARAEGGFWASGEIGIDGAAFLLRLDDAGDVIEALAVPEPAWRPELAQRDGRVYLLYAAPIDPDLTELHSVVFGCVN